MNTLNLTKISFVSIVLSANIAMATEAEYEVALGANSETCTVQMPINHPGEIRRTKTIQTPKYQDICAKINSIRFLQELTDGQAKTIELLAADEVPSPQDQDLIYKYQKALEDNQKNLVDTASSLAEPLSNLAQCSHKAVTYDAHDIIIGDQKIMCERAGDTYIRGAPQPAIR